MMTPTPNPPGGTGLETVNMDNLNAQVDELVMGYEQVNGRVPPRYSSDLFLTGLVIEAMTEKLGRDETFSLINEERESYIWRACFNWGRNPDGVGYADTIPEAVCLAAVAWARGCGVLGPLARATMPTSLRTGRVK